MSEAMLIGLDFSGHGHGHQCTAMIAIVKRDDGGASGRVTSNFDSVFNGLCAAIKENRLLCEIARASFTMRSARVTYGSYIMTLKHVCVNFAACSAMAFVTSGRACPIFMAPKPPA